MKKEKLKNTFKLFKNFQMLWNILWNKNINCDFYLIISIIEKFNNTIISLKL